MTTPEPHGMRIILTGAARGIGRAMAERLARDSRQRHGLPARMVLADLHRDELESLAARLREDGAEVQAIGADMADPATPARLVEAAAAFGGLDAVVSNAGAAIPASLLEARLEDWDQVFALHVRAAWLLGRAAHPLLKAAQGSMVVTTSISGSQPTAPLAAYSPSKAAALMLVRQMALEWGPDGIRVNALSPGITETPGTAPVYADAPSRAQREARVPLRRIAQAEDMANALSFLVGPDAGYVSGTDLLVDGALSSVLMGSLNMAGWKAG
ncbi:SDR family oxidoreductase [Hydrogenophaga sp. 2FB]|uniref:SDR family NAD(P)-dependent oxidoreductase n=1 Tax=Hydrogenophaga sp. 2FB TaxID=2502187 RepID=UPI001BB2771A|nr:SDR family oxidoreductase [Hydrogenophaga sp. 2FB]